MLGIIGAMAVEVEHIVSNMEGAVCREISSVPFWQGRLRGRDVIVGRCGIGKVNAAVCAQIMISVFGVDRIINSGVAGGLLPGMRQCDIAVASGFVQHDVDTSPIGDPVGFISTINRIELPADSDLADVLTQSAKAIGARKVFSGIFACGDQFIASAERSAFIRETFSACACDMEGGAIAQVCLLAGIPFCAVRCISDNADGSAGMSFDTFSAQAAHLGCELVLDFVGRL